MRKQKSVDERRKSVVDSPTVPPVNMEVPQTKRPVLVQGKTKIQPHHILNSVLSQGEVSSNRARYRYEFIKVARYPTPDRPDSGRICVKNELTGEIREFYSLLFNLHWTWE